MWERLAESIAEGEAIQARVEAAQKRLREHEGSLATQRWDKVKRSYSIWTRNTIELQHLLSAAERNEELAVLLIQNMDASKFPVKEEFFNQVDQRLHNMVSSARSLVEHTRTLVRKYPDTEFAAEHDRCNSEIKNSPSAFFLDDFRSYMLHARHAPFITHNEIHDQIMTSEIRLGRTALLDGYGWKSPSRKWLSDGTEDIVLSSLVVDYAKRMRELYAWFFPQFEVIHSTDIDEVNALVEEVNLTISNNAFKSHEEFVANMLRGMAESKGNPAEN